MKKSLRLEDNDNFLFYNDAGVFSFKNNKVLFLRQKDNAQKQFEYLVGNLQVTSEQIRSFESNYKINIDYCNIRNIPYCHIVFPCKAIAYQKEFLKHGITLKNIINHEHIKHPYVYYPNNSEIEKSWFIEDDTHCSSYGYIQIIDRAFKKVGYKLPYINTFFTEIKKQGDLGRMIGSPPISVKEVNFSNSKYTIHSFSNKNILPGNNGTLIIKINPFACISKRLVLFGDSFFVGCLEYLSHIFKEVFFARSPYILKEITNCLKPDIILTGNAERYLVNVPSVLNDSPFFMKFLQRGVDLKNMDETTRQAFINFFSPKESKSYKDWYMSLEKKCYIERGELDMLKKYKLQDSDLLPLKQKAESLEKNNLELAYELMSLALKIKPNGSGIIKKLKQYNERLNRMEKFV